MFFLTKEYIRRQRKHIWLETHIWHAKRFKMINRWGYKLPYASCDKTYRACYRASSRHCLLQDISFYGSIELNGTIENIKDGFEHLTSNKCGLSITAKAYISGKREGKIDLFKYDEYPRGSITKISFIWKPPDNILQINRTLWIFIHPSAYIKVLEELIKVFKLVNTQKTTEIKSFIRNSEYVNEESGICLIELKDTINRFRLTGALSQSVLYHAFKCKSINVNNNEADNDDNHDECSHKLQSQSASESQNWFKEFIQTDKGKLSHQIQSKYWEKYSCCISSPSELIPNIVLNLNIEDPRINRPKKRTKAITTTKNVDIKSNEIYNELPDNLCYSSIWDIEIREEITKNMMSQYEYCKKRNENALIPGEQCKFEQQLQPIPVLLIQRPGSQINEYKCLGYGSGWDIIIPSGYGMCIWLSLIMWGAKPGGLRELNLINHESGYDELLPDSISGKIYYGEKHYELKNKYFRLPPNKRYNYNKLSICSPFKAPFQKLIEEWRNLKKNASNVVTNINDNDDDHDNNKSFYVLRERVSLEMLRNILKKNTGNFPNLTNECLIQVSIKMKTRGNPGDFALICLPKKNDIKLFYKKKFYKDNTPIYVEPIKKDENEEKRKKLRINHKIYLKRLRAKRVREKKKLQVFIFTV